MMLDSSNLGGGTTGAVVGPDVRFGSKADICGAKGHVRFTPESDRKSGGSAIAISAKAWPVVGEWLPRLQLNQPPEAKMGIRLGPE